MTPVSAADPAQFSALPILAFGSVCAVERGPAARFKMRVARADFYEIRFSFAEVRRISLFREDGAPLYSSELSFTADLKEGVVLLEIAPKSERFSLLAIPQSGLPLPFGMPAFPDPASFETDSADPSDPLTPAKIAYEKRKNTLYVYSNAPETLTPEAVNKCLTRQDVSDKSVFFTFEHQSSQLVKQGMKSNGVYYGYRVTNTGKEDAYITVKNVGLQMTGKGDYLGEKEWVDFYNVPFRIPSLDGLSAEQKRLFIGYYNFSCGYPLPTFTPTTYRVPAGEFIYVIGGTTRDAFANFGVSDTADRLSGTSACANGAVLFDVAGSAEGAFYVYNDVAAVNKGGAGYDTHVGVGSLSSPAGSVGEEEGYVVDSSAAWVFNDATKPQKLPVTFENYYNAPLLERLKTLSDGTPEALAKFREALKEFFGMEIVPCAPIPDGKDPHVQTVTDWATHSDAQHYPNAVGTDITVFHTVSSEGTGRPVKEIAYGLYNFSTQGIVLEMGNWMKDYIDRFTFVNRGDRQRKVRVNLTPNGALTVLFRRPDGSVMDVPPIFALQHADAPLDGKTLAGFDLSCRQEFMVPPHSVVQIAVEYNLMANSCGHVKHSVELE